jgi:hypothetical protein
MKFLNHNLFTGDITVNGTTTLSTATGITRTTGDNTTHLATTAFVKAQDYATNTSLGNYVPVSRTLTINGVTLDLSANRAWTIGTSDYTSTLKHTVKAGVAITKGQAVYVTSADGTNMIVGLASNTTEATSSKTMGLIDTTVAANGFTSVITEGLLAGLNTLGATAGDPVWLGTGGNLIYGLTNKPYAPAHLVFIGIVTRVNANNGEIFVKVQNGFELKEIHDVDLITTAPINGHLLGYNGTLWVNKTIAGWLGYTPANASGTTNYLSKFTGSTTLGNSLVYDNGTNVGIGTTSPGYKLDINGGFRVDGTNGDFIVDPNGNDFFFTRNGANYFYGNQVSSSFAFYTNSNLGLFQSSAGNVGIGTNNPAQRLHVKTATNYQGILINGSNAPAIGFAQGDGTTPQWKAGISGNDGTAFSLSTGAANTDRFFVSSSGNVGIGTTSPSNKLQVANGDMSITTGYSFILADTDTNWRLGRNIIVENGNQLTANTMQFVAANAANEGWQFVDDDGNTRFEIGASTGNAWLPSGNLYLNGNLAATQSWVTSQGYLTSYTETDTLASVTARGSSTTGSIFVNGLITGGLGAVATSGTLDWNDVSNARSGSGYTLLLGTATNGMGGGQYYHPISFEYSSKNGGGNMTQLAIPYTGNGIWYRYRYGGSWGSWTRVWDSSDFTSTNISNWNTAYGWGNHASAGYITGNQTITLSGVVTGSGTTAITTAIANGAITNAMLANSSFFVGTTSISLGRATAAQTLTGVSIDGNAATATNVAYSGLTGTVPTWNQNTTGNAATSSTFSTGRTNYKGVTDNAVAGQLMWKNYGNNHTIFDASNSTSPSGGAVNNANSQIAWTGTYPTLMGWNGSETYGVRVDSARLADTAGALTSMNISQFTNNSGYLTAESDTLATVTGRGATTTSPIIVTASEGREVAVYMASSYTTDDLVSGHEYGWYADHWRLGMTRSSAAPGADFVIQWNGARRLSLTNGGNLTVTGTIGATNFSGTSSGTNTGDQTNITGNSGTATALQTGRTLTIGSTGKTFDGTGNVSWTLGEIGAQAAGSYVIANGTSAGDIDADWGQSFKTFDPVPTGTPPLASPNIRTINIGENFGRRTQLAFDYASDVAYFRRRQDTTWGSWREFIHSGNIGSQTVATAGALSSMNISQFTNNSGYITSSGSITGSAGSVAWDNVTSKPSWMTSASLIATHSNANSQVNSGFYENAGGGTNWPSATWYNSINVRHSNQGNYHGFQVAMSYYDNLLWFRSYQGSGTFQSWVYAISSANIGSQSVASAVNADTVDGYHETSFIRLAANSNSPTNGTFAIGSASSRNFIQSHSGQPLDINPLGNAVNVGSELTVTGAVYATGGNSNQWNTAYGWGNHASAGYITGNQTITLSGDVSGSGTTSIVVTVNNIDGWGFVNTGSNSAVNADNINSNGISYYNAGVSNFSGNATDGALYSQRYSDAWQHQIAGDYRSGMIAVRGKNNGTWTAWRTIIDSSTIGSQSVSYATSAGSASSASTAGYADEAKWISFPDGPRDLSDRLPNWNNRSVAWDFVGAGTANGSGNYGGVMTFVPWDGTSASTGDSSYQLAFANTTGVNASGQPKLSIRNGINSTWNAWYTIIHSGNIGDQSVSNASTVAGLAVHTGRNDEVNKIVRTDANAHLQTGWINTTSGAFNTAINKIYCSDDNYVRYQTPANFISNLGLITTSNIGSQSVSSATTATVVVTIQDDPPAGVNGKLWWESDTGKLKVYYGTSSAWVDATPVPDMSLYYAKAGGPISGDVTIQQTLTVVGNTLIQGTLTETSDISLKENILPLESSLDKVMKLNGVSFNKKTTPNVKEIGFIAQEVEAVIPDLVSETNEGIKTVSYSRVTAVLVETIKEQQAQINTQQSQIEELKNMVNMLAEKLNNL